jgi:hypothetical protein
MNKHIKIAFTLLLLIATKSVLKAQVNEELLNLLIQKNVLTQQDIDSLRAEDAIKQQAKPKDKTFTISAQIKPRAELRNGYRFLREDSTDPAFLVLARTRLNFNYVQENKLKLFISLQDARVWGQYDPRSGGGTVQLFEAYAEPYLAPNLSVRIGRQRIMLDNQRLFAENEWRPNAGAHDGVSFHYLNPTNNKFETSLYGAFNELDPSRWFNTNFNPSTLNPSWSFYKYLAVHYLKFKIKDFTVSTLNVLDGFQDQKKIGKHYNRYTNGGRLEYEKGGFYATVAGYVQWNKNAKGQSLQAFYIQPEVKFTSTAWKNNIRIGAEVLSGDDNTKTNTTDHSFDPLYGVAHRFNGHMDLFTSFPADLNKAGLFNPYLFFTQTIGKKITAAAHFHLFYTQNKLVDINKNLMDSYAGFENDFVIQYKPNSYTEVEFGFDYGIFNSTTAAMKQPTASLLNPGSTGGNTNLLPTFTYLQVKISPEIFKTKF